MTTVELAGGFFALSAGRVFVILYTEDIEANSEKLYLISESEYREDDGQHLQQVQSVLSGTVARLLAYPVWVSLSARQSWSLTLSRPPRTGSTSPPYPGSVRSTTSGC